MRFIKTIQRAGLYAHLRIGPYVCAEWNFGLDLNLSNSFSLFSAVRATLCNFYFLDILNIFTLCRGFPVWLKYVPGISFRTDNEPFKVSLLLSFITTFSPLF